MKDYFFHKKSIFRITFSFYKAMRKHKSILVDWKPILLALLLYNAPLYVTPTPTCVIVQNNFLVGINYTYNLSTTLTSLTIKEVLDFLSDGTIDIATFPD